MSWWGGLVGAVGLIHGAERVTRGRIVTENIPEVPAELAERTLQYQNTRSAMLQSWDPAGEGILITTRFGNTSQVHSVARPGGARRQITFFTEPVTGAAYAPDKTYRGFLFQRDVGGGEFFQYYWYDLASGRSTLLTDGKSRNGGARWSNSGDRFIYTSTRRNGRDNDLYLVSLAVPTASKLVKEFKGSWFAVDWSPDDRRLIVANRISANESYLHLLDLETGALTPLNAQPSGADTIAYSAAVWSEDGQSIFIVSDQDTEFATLRELDLRTGRQRTLSADIPWDISSVAVTPDRRTLAFTVNENGRDSLYLFHTRSRQRSAVNDLPLGGIGGLEFSPKGDQLGFTLSTAQTPGDVFVLDLNSRRLERWTQSETGGLNSNKFAVPTLISYPTFDEVSPGQRRQIPAIYYRPTAVGSGQKYPVVINIHGGPESQSTVGFVPSTQFMVNEMGVAVIYPNVRGSSGYGKSYLKLDNGLKREDSVKDIGALLDWIAAQPELDASRVMVMGGSYGGYMVLASMTHYNDRLAGGIDLVGISNFVTFLSNTQDYRRDLRRVEYGDERDPAMKAHLEKISPLTNIDKITRPMLIGQGFNDPRVPVSEAEQALAALKKNGVQPWYFLAMDEGHGFAKKDTANAYQNVTMYFIEKQLLRR